MTVSKKKASKKKVKGSKRKTKGSKAKRSKRKIKGSKAKGSKAKGSKRKGSKAKGTRTYKKQIMIISDDEERNIKCKKLNGKSKECRSARTVDNQLECWYNYDTELCTGFVPKN